MPDSLSVGISAGNLLKASSYFVGAVPILSAGSLSHSFVRRHRLWPTADSEARTTGRIQEGSQALEYDSTK